MRLEILGRALVSTHFHYPELIPLPDCHVSVSLQACIPRKRQRTVKVGGANERNVDAHVPVVGRAVET
jgi:hypothetical protein